MSPFSACSSSRTRPSEETHSRPEAPESSGLEASPPPPPCPVPLGEVGAFEQVVGQLDVGAEACDGRSTAGRRGRPGRAACAGGVGPEPTARARAVSEMPMTSTAPHSRSRRERGRRRRMFTALGALRWGPAALQLAQVQGSAAAFRPDKGVDFLIKRRLPGRARQPRRIVPGRHSISSRPHGHHLSGLLDPARRWSSSSRRCAAERREAPPSRALEGRQTAADPGDRDADRLRPRGSGDRPGLQRSPQVQRRGRAESHLNAKEQQGRRTVRALLRRLPHPRGGQVVRPGRARTSTYRVGEQISTPRRPQSARRKRDRRRAGPRTRADAGASLPGQGSRRGRRFRGGRRRSLSRLALASRRYRLSPSIG